MHSIDEYRHSIPMIIIYPQLESAEILVETPELGMSHGMSTRQATSLPELVLPLGGVEQVLPSTDLR